MCRAKILLLLGFTIIYAQANDTPTNNDEFYYPKRHLSSIARDGLLPNKRYVASLIKNIKPLTYFQPESKKFVHPFHVFDKAEPKGDKRYIGTVLAKSGQGRSSGLDKRSLMDGIIFGEDMRSLLNSNSDKKYDSNFSDDMEVLLGSDRDKKSYGVDGMVFGEDFRRFNPYDPQKKSYGVDGMVFGEDMRNLMQHYPEDDKRGFNSLMDGMVLGEDLRNEDNYDKRGYGLMDGMVFGEDLRNKVLQNYNDKRSHSLMDGMVFAEDLRKAIQEASVKKEKQKLKDEKDLMGKYTTKIMSKVGGKRSVQALAREGYLNKPSGQGKRAGLEALARNGLLKSNKMPNGKRAGLEALARNGYLNKCPPNSQTNKRGLSILAKNGLMPVKSIKKDSNNVIKMDSKRNLDEYMEDYSNLDDDSTAQEYYYNPRPRPHLSYFAKRPFLGHRISSASATTRNIPLVERDVIPSEEKRVPSEEELQDAYENHDYDVQKRYVAALLKEASQPAKIDIRGVPKSVEDEATEDAEEQPGHSESKRAFTGENSISDEYTMPVMQNSASRDVDEVINELAQLSNSKRYYAVRGGGRILGGRLQELGKQKQKTTGHRGFL